MSVPQKIETGVIGNVKVAAAGTRELGIQGLGVLEGEDLELDDGARLVDNHGSKVEEAGGDQNVAVTVAIAALAIAIALAIAAPACRSYRG